MNCNSDSSTTENCPDWAKETLPLWLKPYQGLAGLPEHQRRAYPSVNAVTTEGIDRYQANHFLNFRPETADFLRESYTPLQVNYRPSLFPALEAISTPVQGRNLNAEQTAEALLEILRVNLRHPTIPPFGIAVAANRNFDEEALLQSGSAWCNEQVRVFVRLCQTQQIPARIVHLFYAPAPGGHTVAEFHNGTQWCLVDASYFVLYRDSNGQPLSAEACHDRAAGQARYGELFYQSVASLRCIGKDEDPVRLAQWSSYHGTSTPADYAAQLDCFALINHPLPLSSD